MNRLCWYRPTDLLPALPTEEGFATTGPWTIGSVVGWTTGVTRPSFPGNLTPIAVGVVIPGDRCDGVPVAIPLVNISIGPEKPAD